VIDATRLPESAAGLPVIDDGIHRLFDCRFELLESDAKLCDNAEVVIVSPSSLR
jgi:hypothetical protein